MTHTTMVVILIVVILCACILRSVFFRGKFEKSVTIILDESDNNTFVNVMSIFPKFDILGASYDDTTDVIRIVVKLRSRDYDDFINSIKQIKNVEVA